MILFNLYHLFTKRESEHKLNLLSVKSCQENLKLEDIPPQMTRHIVQRVVSILKQNYPACRFNTVQLSCWSKNFDDVDDWFFKLVGLVVDSLCCISYSWTSGRTEEEITFSVLA
ncbi:hypothetical protein T10_13179 [Trichinella papuae]|uniref:Uncharacterized protein n=1 Tax=Trichinella papuae TaxID=268474 RepID=A0A0V1M908_9BILA|nr:hypothetical protein T10_13179 [Trichinella papuae]